MRGVGLVVAVLVGSSIVPAASRAATSYPQSDGSDGACNFTQSGVLDTITNAFTPSGGGSIPMGHAGVFNCTTLTVASGVTLTTVGTGVLDFRATGNVSMAGTIDLDGGSGTPGAGGNTGQSGALGSGGTGFPGSPGTGSAGGAGGSDGGGGGGGSSSSTGGGGGGGGPSGGGGGASAGGSAGGGGGNTGGVGATTAGGGGGAGNGGSTPAAQSGQAGTGANGGGGGGGGFGNVNIDLHPGSGGGGGGSSSGTPGSISVGGGGGGGGGALRIVTPGTITVSGAVVANGGSGGSVPNSSARGGGGGGGSGGDIYLAAPTVSLSGGLMATGGVGGAASGPGTAAGGQGSGGRIRIFANSLSGSANTNPAAVTGIYGYNLSVSRSGTGSGSVSSSPAGITCGDDCADFYDPSATVTLTVAPATGSMFAGWSGGGCSGTGTCQVTMSADTSVTVTFSDATPPQATAPLQSLVRGSALGGSDVPVRFDWSVSDNVTPVRSIRSSLQQQASPPGGGYSDLVGPKLATTATAPLPANTALRQFRIRALDGDGNTGYGPAGPAFRVTAYQETSKAIAYSGTWRQASRTGAFGGGVHYSSQAGAKATLTSTGRNLAVVAPLTATGASARICVDGAHCSNVDLSPSRGRGPRKEVYVRNGLSASNTHRVQVTVLSGRVDLDAFVALR
jgi:hypothetical protein